MNPCKDEREDLEMTLLLEAIYGYYGFDFREYSRASLRRRILRAIQDEGLTTISGLQERLLHDEASFERFLLAISVNVSAMFRDPGFFRAFREKAVPWLRTYPFIRIWQAGCSMGEEVYSLAILLQEEKLYEKCRIYATDVNELVLRKAKAGIYPLDVVRKQASDYLKAGGKQSFADYYTSAYDSAIFHVALKEHIVFSQHNLATDGGLQRVQRDPVPQCHDLF